VGGAPTSDLEALRNYIERFDYDPVGNLQSVVHQATNGNWTRAYSYCERSQLQPAAPSNRLSQTALDGESSEQYRY